MTVAFSIHICIWWMNYFEGKKFTRKTYEKNIYLKVLFKNMRNASFTDVYIALTKRKLLTLLLYYVIYNNIFTYSIQKLHFNFNNLHACLIFKHNQLLYCKIYNAFVRNLFKKNVWYNFIIWQVLICLQMHWSKKSPCITMFFS